MTAQEVKEAILKEQIVVILRRVPIDKIGKLAQALVAGGIRLLEVTFDQVDPDPIGTYQASIRAIREAVGNQLTLGSGTTLTAEQVDAAQAVGAQFIISPNADEDVIRRTKELGMVSIPGAMTPTEICQAYKWGADIVKLFPADDLGYHYIWNIRGPITHIPLMATGGVNAETIPLYFKQGIQAVGTGGSIVKRDLLEAEDYDAIRELAKKHVDAIRNTRT